MNVLWIVVLGLCVPWSAHAHATGEGGLDFSAMTAAHTCPSATTYLYKVTHNLPNNIYFPGEVYDVTVSVVNPSAGGYLAGWIMAMNQPTLLNGDGFGRWWYPYACGATDAKCSLENSTSISSQTSTYNYWARSSEQTEFKVMWQAPAKGTGSLILELCAFGGPASNASDEWACLNGTLGGLDGGDCGNDRFSTNADPLGGVLMVYEVACDALPDVEAGYTLASSCGAGPWSADDTCAVDTTASCPSEFSGTTATAGVYTCHSNGSWIMTEMAAGCTPPALYCGNPWSDQFQAKYVACEDPNNWLDNDMCAAKCGEGYTRTDTGSATLCWSGAWTAFTPGECEPVICPEPSWTSVYVEPAVPDCDDLYGGTGCAYECAVGYHASPPGRLECGPSSGVTGDPGVWSSFTGCARESCGSPPYDDPATNPKGARHIDSGLCSNTLTGDSCTPACAVGHDATPPETIVCEPTGWSAWNDTSCQIVDCGAPSWTDRYMDPGNCSNTTYLEECVPSCGVGWKASGPLSVMCLANGSWSVFQGCEPESCGEPAWEDPVANPGPYGAKYTNPSNCVEHTTGKTCTPACALGQQGSAAGEITCQPDNQWSAFTGCERTPCPNAPFTSQYVSRSCGYLARYGDSCTPGCGSGYQESPPGIVNCTIAGTWTSFTGCTPMDCSAPSFDGIRYRDPGAGCANHLFPNTCTPWCGTGYTGSSPGAIQCTTSGWTSFTGCNRVSCGSPSWNVPYDSPVSGCASIVYESVCTPDCHPGYTNSSAGSVTCQSNGQWTGFSGCAPVHCEALNFTERFQDPGNCIMDTHPTTCTPVCGTGYTASPANPAQCQWDATWAAWTGCEPVDCGEPAWDVQYTAPAVCNTKYAGAECVPVCGAGYTRTSPTPLSCGSDGVWSSFGGCERVDCGPPAFGDSNSTTPSLASQFLEDPAHLCTNTLYEARCTPVCGTGFTRTGPKTIECQSNGEWSSFDGCDSVFCYDHPFPFPPRYLGACGWQGRYFATGYNCTPVCGEMWKGSPPVARVCQWNGEWSPLQGCLGELGAPCSTHQVCASGICAQGYCCDTACEEECTFCDGSEGTTGIAGVCQVLDADACDARNDIVAPEPESNAAKVAVITVGLGAVAAGAVVGIVMCMRKTQHRRFKYYTKDGVALSNDIWDLEEEITFTTEATSGLASDLTTLAQEMRSTK